MLSKSIKIICFKYPSFHRWPAFWYIMPVCPFFRNPHTFLVWCINCFGCLDKNMSCVRRKEDDPFQGYFFWGGLHNNILLLSKVWREETWGDLEQTDKKSNKTKPKENIIIKKELNPLVPLSVSGSAACDHELIISYTLKCGHPNYFFILWNREFVGGLWYC